MSLLFPLFTCSCSVWPGRGRTGVATRGGQGRGTWRRFTLQQGGPAEPFLRRVWHPDKTGIGLDCDGLPLHAFNCSMLRAHGALWPQGQVRRIGFGGRSLLGHLYNFIGTERGEASSTIAHLRWLSSSPSYIMHHTPIKLGGYPWHLALRL